MATYWMLVLVSWAAFLACWYLVSRAYDSNQRARLRSRLVAEGMTKSSKARPQTQALLTSEDRRTGRLVLKLLSRLRIRHRLQLLLEQAGLKWRVARLMHACLSLFLTGFTVVWYGVPFLRAAALPVGLLAGALPIAYVWRLRNRRLAKFEEQFPDSLEFVSRSMRAGHAFSVSLEMLQKEFQEPLAGEFRRTFDEHNLGLPLESALERLATRVPLMDVQFFVSAVLLQKRTGGNLAELLDKLAYVIRERFKLRGRIRAVSAHGRMTGSALSTIPLIVAGLMFFTNREYIMFFFTDPTGRLMMGAGFGMQLMGYGVIRKIVSIEV